MRVDLKSRFRDDWGFPIDDAAWDLMQPLVSKLVPQRDPASYAGPDRTAGINEVISLLDAYVFDQEGDPLSVQWRIINQPLGAHGDIGDSEVLHPTFAANRHGQYTLSLSASDQWVVGAPDNIIISVTDPKMIFDDGFE